MVALNSSGSRIRVWRLRNRGSIFGRCRKFSSASWPTQPSVWLIPGVLCVRVKHLHREGDHLPSCRDAVKKMWMLTPLPHTSTWYGAPFCTGTLIFISPYSFIWQILRFYQSGHGRMFELHLRVNFIKSCPMQNLIYKLNEDFWVQVTASTFVHPVKVITWGRTLRWISRSFVERFEISNSRQGFVSYVRFIFVTSDTSTGFL